MVAQITRTEATPASPTIEYVSGDHLGSASVVTNANGEVTGQQHFDPFGSRYTRTELPLLSARGSVGRASEGLSKGFTGHEMDDDIGLINMQGRMFDGLTGRFLTPDPVIADATDLQTHNPYSYVLNNPLRYVDPTGYFAQNPDDPGPTEEEQKMRMAQEWLEMEMQLFRDTQWDDETESTCLSFNWDEGGPMCSGMSMKRQMEIRHQEMQEFFTWSKNGFGAAAAAEAEEKSAQGTSKTATAQKAYPFGLTRSGGRLLAGVVLLGDGHGAAAGPRRRDGRCWRPRALEFGGAARSCSS
jgi:RHS repeat-associated protein